MKAAQTTILQAYQNAPWRNQFQAMGVFALAVVMIAIVAGIYLNVTSRASTIGREVQSLQREILITQRVNADLENQLALLSSASALEERAGKLGFRPVSTDNVLYIEVPGYSGRQEVVFAPPPDPAPVNAIIVPDEYNETLFQWFTRLVRENDLEPLAPDLPLHPKEAGPSP